MLGRINLGFVVPTTEFDFIVLAMNFGFSFEGRPFGIRA
jgi:hypothetical protein